jgi:hypothetical protein
VALYSWVAPTAEQHRPVAASRILPARAADTAGAVGEADMRYPAAHYLGIVPEFGPRPDPRSREQQANLLCDDDAELLVILGIEMDAVGVA